MGRKAGELVRQDRHQGINPRENVVLLRECGKDFLL